MCGHGERAMGAASLLARAGSHRLDPDDCTDADICHIIGAPQ